MYKNFILISNKRSIWFIFLTFPPFGFVFKFLLDKIFFKIINEKTKRMIYNSIIFKSTIRFIDVEEKNNISSFLNKYKKIDVPKSEYKINLQKKMEELNKFGYTNLGVIFNNMECKKFIASLNNQLYYDSQVALQSSGVKKRFNYKTSKNSNFGHYCCFSPELTLSFKPLNKFIESNDIKFLVNNYLKFYGKIYNAMTWYNSVSKGEHYVHRLHRDYDDFKFIGLFIYWNNIQKDNGPFNFVPKSHRKNLKTFKEISLCGNAGSVFMVDSFGLHRGSKLKKGERFISTFRFGNIYNNASINDGFVSTPQHFIP